MMWIKYFLDIPEKYYWYLGENGSVKHYSFHMLEKNKIHTFFGIEHIK